MVVLHYTGMATAMAAIERLCDPASEVSSHYVVCPDGCIVRLVPEEMRAWHAGVACWGPVTDVNSRSIGIEIVNPGHELGYPPFPETQMAALDSLLGELLARHAISPERVVSHACVSPGRKRDPGHKFDWRRLALRGLSIWDFEHARGDYDSDASADAERFQAAARRFGYSASESGQWCSSTLAIWSAFAMRFLPARAEQPPSAEGIALLERLAAQWPVARQP
jgi:N-acetylmuramoyl-L-alanine amidase